MDIPFLRGLSYVILYVIFFLTLALYYVYLPAISIFSMKATRFILIFIIALVCLLGLQGLWLYNTYQLEKKQTRETVNSTFIDAAKMELSERMNRLEALFKNRGIDSIAFDTFSFPMDSSFFDHAKVVPVEFLMMQYMLHVQVDYPLDVQLLDTIYSSQLAGKKIAVDYTIQYTDSVGRVLENTNPAIGSGFETDAVPVIHGNQLRVVADITAPAVFRNMLGMLMVSVVIVSLIIGCFVYGIRSFITQQQLGRLRDNFMYALTHDMKTPLGTIHTVLDQSGKGLLDGNPEMRSKFNDIGKEQVMNLQALVNQILTIAQMEQRKLTVHKELIDLPAIIGGLVDKFSVHTGKEIHFDTELDLNGTEIYADPLYLGNAISNLIDNAIKYSGPVVNINLKASVKGKQVYIRVADNGFGISETDQKKIFDRFERGAELKRKSASGFGIGLNYVKTVIESHGGGITLTSKEGAGSEFVITLPVQ